MLAKVLPLAIGLIGLGAGVGAGIALRPEAAAPETHAAEPADGALDHAAVPPCGDDGDAGAHAPATDDAADAHGDADAHGAAGTEFVALENQFVIPIIDGDAVGGLVVLSITLEVGTTAADLAYARLPKLRDGFLRVLLDHANAGGFDGRFTANGSLDDMRRALMEVGRKELSSGLEDVLILNLNRQDL